jgi:hypothetical protein
MVLKSGAELKVHLAPSSSLKCRLSMLCFFLSVEFYETARSSFFLVLLVSDSEYSKSAGPQAILFRGCIYLVSPTGWVVIWRCFRLGGAQQV